jgi:hypothetical protein
MPEVQLMYEMQNKVVTVLESAVRHLRGIGAPSDLTGRLESLIAQVDQPCVVAVVGRVNAGKSTFINALLGEDLAQVGATETTATITYFRYGQADPMRPVRCYWRNGQCTDERRGFLEGLQGYDIEALRRADGIDHLEYRLLNPYLERITLVDTPGTGGVVDDHEDRTAEFLHLAGKLRERQAAETQRFGSEADAVIYLFGAIARSADQELLDDFQSTTQGHARALNAVGVLSKIDLHPDLMAGRDRLAAAIADQLKDYLNTVIPISAGIQRGLDGLLGLDTGGLERVIKAGRAVPPERLARALASERAFLDPANTDWPLNIEERRALKGDLPWRVFAAITQVVADPLLDPPSIRASLTNLAGFGAVRETLERQFLRRSQLLRAYRIMNHARSILRTISFSHLPELRRRARDNAARRDRFLTALGAAQGVDPTIMTELAGFVREHFTTGMEPKAVVDALDREFAMVFNELREFNTDFVTLQDLESEDNAGRFAFEELSELRALLGQYGMELEKRLGGAPPSTRYVDERQQYWSEVAKWDTQPIRAGVAQRAVTRYGIVLRELLAVEGTF